MPLPQAMADPSLLSAELEADEEEEAALRRLLLQVGTGRESRPLVPVPVPVQPPPVPPAGEPGP